MKRKDGDQYLLQDGTYADPKECKKGDDGVLRHENGVGVALGPDGEPMTMGTVTEASKNVEAAKVGESDLAPPDVAAKPDKRE